MTPSPPARHPSAAARRGGRPPRLPALVAEAGAALAAAGVRPAAALQAAGSPPPAAGPAPASAPAEGALTATVTAVSGVAQARAGPTARWAACKVGQALGPDAEIRTGPDGLVRFAIPPDQTVTVDRLSQTTLARSLRTRGGRVDTEVVVPRGRVELNIQPAGVEHKADIRSPNGTLAVRGTRVVLYDQRPFPPSAVSLTGRAEFAAAKRQVALGSAGGSRVSATAGRSAAEEGLAAATVDPAVPRARTGQEAALVAYVLQSGATFTLGDDKRVPVVTGGSPPTDAQLSALLPGRLNFVLRWGGDANLDLVVGNQRNEVLAPVAGLAATPTGGRTLFDHRGGPRGGFEVGFWPAGFPQGSYPVAVTHVGGAETGFTFDAFLNGQRTPFQVPRQGNATVTTLTGTVGPTAPTFGVVVPVGLIVPPPTPAPPGLPPVPSGPPAAGGLQPQVVATVAARATPTAAGRFGPALGPQPRPAAGPAARGPK